MQATVEGWAVAIEAVNVGAATPFVMEVTDMAAAAYCAMEDMDPLASTKLL